MNKILFTLLIFINLLFCDVIIRGVVIDEESNPVPYANIYIKDSFDGTSSDQKGQFL